MEASSPRRNHSFSRRFAASVAAAVVVGLMGSAGTALADPPVQAKTDAANVEILEVDAEHSPGVVAAAALAPETSNHQQGWQLRASVFYRNKGKTIVNLTSITMDTDVSQPQTATIGASLAPGTASRRIVPITLTSNQPPAPTKMGLQLWFEGYSTPTTVIRPVVLDRNHTPSGGYRFPARSEDLDTKQLGGKPVEAYWSIGDGGHANDRAQRYGYDLGVMAYNPIAGKWQEEKWDPETGATLSLLTNSDWWIFDTPVYAMHDSTVLACRRTVAENVPGIQSVGGGNGYWVDHGNGEFALYAHLRENTVPAELCPVESDGTLNATPVKIRAGDYLGRVGNTGQSPLPHMHIHVQDAPPADWIDPGDGEGVPLNFHNVTVRVRSGFDPSDQDAAGWAMVHAGAPAVIGNAMLIDPNPCGWFRYEGPEAARHGVPARCWQDTVDSIAEAGYRMVFVDAYGFDGEVYFNGIFRPADGKPWSWVFGLTGAEYQQAVDANKKGGLRLELAESYLQDGSVRYAAIFGKALAHPEAYHGLTAAEHQAQFDTLTAKGYHPVSVSVVEVGGSRRYTAVYEKGDVGSWVLDSTVLIGDYQALFDAQAASGRKVAHLNAYEFGGQIWVSALFQSAGPPVTAAHGLTSAQYQSAYEANRSAGRLTRVVTGYDDGRTTRFAAVWSPPQRPGTPGGIGHGAGPGTGTGGTGPTGPTGPGGTAASR